MCLPPTGQHENSPSGGNTLLRRVICVSLPVHETPLINHPVPEHCEPHMSIHPDLNPLEEGSHPKGDGTRQGPSSQSWETGLCTQQLLQRALEAV